VAVGEASGLSLETIEAEFHRQHLAAYGHSSSGASIELVNARLTAYGLVPRPSGEATAAEPVDRCGAGRAASRVVRRRATRVPGVGSASAFPSEPTLRGPAIVEEFRRDDDRTPGWRRRGRRARQHALRARDAGMIDPITLEVLREALVSVVREMRVTLVRTAFSSILYEGEDFSCVLMDGHAQIVAMSKGQDHPLHIVPIGWSMKAVREKFGDDIHPRHFLHNEPYTGGTHLNDVAMIYPLFAADGELFVFRSCEPTGATSGA